MDEHPCQQTHHNLTCDERAQIDGGAKSHTSFRNESLQRMLATPLSDLWQSTLDDESFPDYIMMPEIDKVGWVMKENTGSTFRTLSVMIIFTKIIT